MKNIYGIVFLIFWTQNVWASNYPPDYTYQKVYLLNMGDAALVAHVSSGILNQYVIGYKNRGVLNQPHIEELDLVIFSTCHLQNGSKLQKTTTYTLGREWHGTGFLSAPFDLRESIPHGCPTHQAELLDISFAFSDRNGNWDSNTDHLNYFLFRNSKSWKESEGLVYFDTKKGIEKINLEAWTFIVNQMK